MVRVLPLLLLAGCLYTDDVNHRPDLTIHPAAAGTSSGGGFATGSTIEIDSVPSDEEDGVSLAVTFKLVDETGAVPAPCRADYTQTRNRAEVHAYQAGHYRVIAYATDTQNAVSADAVADLTVVDPMILLSPSGAIDSGPRPTMCAAFTAGVPAALQYDGVVPDPRGGARPPANLGCADPPPVALGWTVSGGTKPVLTLTDQNGNCLAPDPTVASGSLTVPDYQTRVCLWADDPLPGDATYHVAFSATIAGEGQTVSRDVSFVPDQPPCLTFEDPVAGSYVIDRDHGFTGVVTGVDDDRDGYGSDLLRYVWSVWQRTDAQPDGFWTALPPSPYASYTLDTASRNIGDQLKLRVEVVDRSGTLAAGCAPDAAICCLDSCTAAATVGLCPAHQCAKWKTWDLELR
jgi:hypothetical protein